MSNPKVAESGHASTAAASMNELKSGFCDMVGVPWHAVQSYKDGDLLSELSEPQPGQDRFLVNWRSLRSAMASMLKANGITHAL